MASSTLFVSVEAAGLEDLNAASYHVTFDPNVLEIVAVTGGDVGGVTVPVDLWNEVKPGVASVVQSLPGLGVASGSGRLARFEFFVVGVEGSASDIGFDHRVEQRVLSNDLAEAISAGWVGATVRVVGE